MKSFRYPQSCPVARAAEVIGERWTLLIIRELALGPQRFSDLRERLSGVSSSVLTARINGLLEKGLITREQLDPPAASTVYRLSDSGQALVPVLLGLVRWGARYFSSPHPGDHFEPDWLRLGLLAYSRREATPAHTYAIRIQTPGKPLPVRVAGGRGGTTVTLDDGPAELTITLEPSVLMGLVTGAIHPSEALAGGKLSAEGRVEILEKLPELFDLNADST
ncbi:MAG: winged helix-turn-helix transcriptional regulator [Deltaproteobacteria bacterium]|nr:winged helix-turn-helix transcriptional regulator [Deltaproteobacteria bacterium]